MRETVASRIYFYKGLVVLATLTLIMSVMEWGISKSWAYFYYYLSIIMILESLHQLRKISLKMLLFVVSFLFSTLVFLWIQTTETTSDEPLMITIGFVGLTFMCYVGMYLKKKK